MIPTIPAGWKAIRVSGVEDTAAKLPEFLATPGKHAVFWVPALEMVIWDPWMIKGLDWLVVAGDSGHQDAKPFVQEWAGHAINSGRRHGVPVFIAQMGSNCRTWAGNQICHRHPAGARMSEWPVNYRVQQYPSLLSA